METLPQTPERNMIFTVATDTVMTSRRSVDHFAVGPLHISLGREHPIVTVQRRWESTGLVRADDSMALRSHLTASRVRASAVLGAKALLVSCQP